jgi:pyruvate kinase
MNFQTIQSGSHERRTKIIATLGPATDDPAVLTQLIRAGANVFRINMSHGDSEAHLRRASLVRQVSAEMEREVALLADLQGPKIRVERFAAGQAELVAGEAFILDAEDAQTPGTNERVGVSYRGLPEDVEPGDILLLDDGLISVVVDRVEGGKVHCVVELGGTLRDRKGLNLKGGGLSIPGLADHDIPHIELAARMGIDFLAVSFVSDGRDLERARALLRDAGSDAALVAKIERMEAIHNLEEICDAAEVIMVARGDLGVEIGDEELPGLQKRIIRTALRHNRIVATATQMMQSMVENPVPTRAEVLDVANAVIDGSDAVMLSAETAVGKHPVRVVEAVHRICLGAERHFEQEGVITHLNVRFQRIDQAIAMFMATKVSVQAIIALTESGSTAQWLSRVQTAVPIFAFSRNDASRRRMHLFRGVCPVRLEAETDDEELVVQSALRGLWRTGVLQPDDRVIVTMGDRMGKSGGTNTLRYIKLDAEGRSHYAV